MHNYILVFLALLLTACHPATQPDASELFEADRNFSKAAAELGFNRAFIEFAHPGAVLLRANSMPVVGKSAIAALFEKADTTGIDFSWEPLGGDIAASGDLGYTYGIYTIQKDTLVQQGTYVSVWKKDGEGNWKYVLDTGNEGLGEESSK